MVCLQGVWNNKAALFEPYGRKIDGVPHLGYEGEKSTVIADGTPVGSPYYDTGVGNRLQAVASYNNS